MFLQRYPTTATNRNRARARWTYYHFLGVDIEKSAARTTDPDALSDSDNPTMNNPACTVCHSVLDPMAGAFQNYGDEGFWRDNDGALDSLAQFYKHPPDGSLSPYQHGDTWYRDMRAPGFNGEFAPDPDSSLQWLAERIVADDRFAEAAVRFWWPAIMGADIAAPPEDDRDSDFRAVLLGATAQSSEVKRLADAFRAGIAGGAPFNAKDLLTEIALSPWFRAESMAVNDPVRYVALRNAGVERLLTPEELQRKTEAITGYAWYRRHYGSEGWSTPSRLNDRRRSLSSGSYTLLYGGIDSNGITHRAVDVTPMMAAVAQSHAVEVSCPVVLREFFLLPDDQRRLLGGIQASASPVEVASDEFSIVAESWESRQTVSLSAFISPGSMIVRLTFSNPYFVGPGRGRHRVLNLDRLTVRDQGGDFERTVELESLPEQDCADPNEGPFYQMHNRCSVTIPIEVPEAGNYVIDVVADHWRAGTEPARLEISIESDRPTPTSEKTIRNKLVELHANLFGTTGFLRLTRNRISLSPVR